MNSPRPTLTAWARPLAAACALLLAARAKAADPGRRVVSLDGAWAVAEGGMDQVPSDFSRTVPVPGLVSLAQPAFADPGLENPQGRGNTRKDPRRDAFWYRRSFPIDGPVPGVAILKVGKAMFGTRVIVNGRAVGDHVPSFTPGFFDVRAALRTGPNEVLVRVGADRDALPPGVPDGFDFEKTRYIPGIFDSVELILTGTPHISNLQVAPDIERGAVRVEALVRNAGGDTVAALRFTVREASSGREVGEAAGDPVSLPAGAERTVEVRVPVAGCRLWSPEDPFLYVLEADSGADRMETRFGMRTFRFDPATRTALLNGRPYFMRGSNVTIYRFFEDGACGGLPWNPAWVRLFHRRMREMHWNCLRYCIGFPPEDWYRIADEEGILIQDEFPIWYGGTNWSKLPAALGAGELQGEYAEWMRERWNHPSVVIWDASNETASTETAVAVQRVRGLDLSNRPWDNSYATPRVPGDVFESHPYHFSNPRFRLSDLARETPVPQGNELPNPGDSPVVINEYGWLWLNRDGSPTTLTRELYRNLLGPDSTTQGRRRLYARYLAAETEFWRSHRRAAAVMHFTSLGYSRPDGQTSDHWTDVAALTWEPEFLRYVRDSFAPVGVMIDAWAEAYGAGSAHEFTVAAINDLYRDWRGTLRLRLLRDGRLVDEREVPAAVPALGRVEMRATLRIPDEPGPCQVEAVLVGTPDGDVTSLRDFTVVPR